MRGPFLALGILACIVGALWIGQGTGMVDWPSSSFMIGQMPWAYFGAAMVVLGLGLVSVALRR